MPGHSGMHLDGGGRGVSRGCQRRRRRRKRLGAAAGGGASGMSQWRGWAASRFRRKRVAVVRHRFHRRLATACFDRAKERQRERGDRRCATRGSHRSRVRFAGHPDRILPEIDDRNLTQPDSGVNGQFGTRLADHRSLVPATPRTRWRRPQTSRHRWLHPLTQHATLRGQREQSSTGLHRLLRLPTLSSTQSSLHRLVAWLLTVPRWGLLRLMQSHRHHLRRRALLCVLQRRLRLKCARLVVRCGGRLRAPP